MIIAKFNAENTDGKKAVPSFKFDWTPTGDWNKDGAVKVHGRLMKAGEFMDFQQDGGESWNFNKMFLATVDSIEGIEWEDEDGNVHPYTPETLVDSPVSAGNVRVVMGIIYGWGNAILTANRLTDDEVKNSGSATKQAG